MRSFSILTGNSGSRRTLPFNCTRPARIISAACEREQYPSFEIALARPTFRGESLDLTSFMLIEGSGSIRRHGKTSTTKGTKDHEGLYWKGFLRATSCPSWLLILLVP